MDRNVERILFAAFFACSAASASTPASPYAGEESRPIKALSAEEVAGLLAGEGMGYAKSAELNGYPGPAHVLELAAQLGLDEQQLRATRAIHGRMEAQARTLGAELVRAEEKLEELFRTRSATPQNLQAALDAIAKVQARLRGVHLAAHIEQRALLSPGQVALYAQLRGYDGDATRHHHGGHRH